VVLKTYKVYQVLSVSIIGAYFLSKVDLVLLSAIYLFMKSNMDLEYRFGR